MARQLKWPEDSYDRLAPLLRTVSTPRDMRRLLCVWLSVALSLTPQQIAVAIGLTPPSVRRIQQSFLVNGVANLMSRPRGGRRHANLTLDEERELLRPFLFRAERGVATELQTLWVAYERRVKHKVPKSTIYRLLARHHASSSFSNLRRR